MIDYSADLYDPAYLILGVPAMLSAGTAGEIEITVIDETRRKTVSASAGVEVRTVEPAACARIPELTAKGVERDDYMGSALTFNGRNWVVRNFDVLGSPNGEDLGQVRFLLKASNG